MEYLYRAFDDYRFTSFDSTIQRVSVKRFPIVKHTRCGAWIETGAPKHRFVNLTTAYKQYASETVEDAVEQYRKRRIRQLRILHGQLARAEEYLRLADNIVKDDSHGALDVYDVCVYFTTESES